MMPYPVPQEKIRRLIVSTDMANEADDPFALAHALLTPLFDIKAVIAAHYGIDRHSDSALRSYRKTKELLSLMEIGSELLFMGEKMPLCHSSDPSGGALQIVREASSGSITVLALGPLTDIAVAIREDGSIIENLTVIWTGGAKYPDGGWEYNLFNDIEAANYVISSGVRLIMIPKDVYQCLNVPFSELYLNLRGYKLGQYLFNQLMEHSMEDGPRNALIRSGDGWILGDNAVLSPLLCPRSTEIETIPAPFFTENGMYNLADGHGTIEIVRKIDARYIISDMFSKFRIYGEGCEDRGI